MNSSFHDYFCSGLQETCHVISNIRDLYPQTHPLDVLFPQNVASLGWNFASPPPPFQTPWALGPAVSKGSLGLYLVTKIQLFQVRDTFFVECKHAASTKWSTSLMVNVCEGDLGFTIKLLAVHHLENRWYSSYATWADRPTYTSLETGIFYHYTRTQCTILTFRIFTFFHMFCNVLYVTSWKISHLNLHFGRSQTQVAI